MILKVKVVFFGVVSITFTFCLNFKFLIFMDFFVSLCSFYYEGMTKNYESKNWFRNWCLFSLILNCSTLSKSYILGLLLVILNGGKA